MATPLTLLEQRAQEPWLIHDDAKALLYLAKQRYQDLLRYSTPTIFLAESNPLQFLAGFIAACSVPSRVFLCNPQWGETEWQQVFRLARPTLIWSDRAIGDRTDGTEIANERSDECSTALIMIATGGTSGTLRFAMHTWETLSASVQGFRDYFECDDVHSFCVLPLHHVSGLMQFMRSLLSGGRLILCPWKSLEANAHLGVKDFFISLVPTQLQRLLPHSSAWLSQFRAILLGGAPAWDDLLEEARSRHLPLAPTYGMTETASQIATLKPEDFLNGQRGCGRVLPHAHITSLNHKISIQAKSLMLGYYPTLNQSVNYEPDDLGYIDHQGFLHILGRESSKIITGGENAFPPEIESAIRSTGLVREVAVLGISDRAWGQTIAAVYVPQPGVSSDRIQQALVGKLVGYKHPKHWIAVEHLPHNAQGKLSRVQLQHIAALSASKTRLCP
ncbi:2-succinylbenzoate--CoA ligase [Myxacorys almedinensis]|uniref:AMP-binding protein n=1 Tax=Myxacorys almedinensis A TaxID=2690445 RepID=A0A8J7Z1K6_9CYAN|nr:2-succinylbenzoate--CoA ligase [Myxacorys almedinensis]NDJ16106.1 AMP-binding protein [Myxacorys almedinensis A]